MLQHYLKTKAYILQLKENDTLVLLLEVKILYVDM